MMRSLTLFFILIFSIWAQAANDAPQSFTLDGYLYEAGTTTALLDSAAKIKVQVLDPSKTCLLYEEQQTVDTSSTSGYFNIQVGSAIGSTKRTSGDVGLTMIQVFQNAAAVTAGSVTTSSCTGSTYTPAAGDARYFRIIVTPSATGVADTLSPDATVGSAPNALVAQSLEGVEKASILQANSTSSVFLTQSNLNSLFTNPGYGYLQSILAGSFMQTGSAGADLPILSAAPSAPAAGNIWFDSSSNSIHYYNGTAIETLGTAGSGLTSLTVSSNLTLNGTAGGSTTSSGTIDLNAAGTAGSYYKVTTDAKGRVISGNSALVATDIPSLSWSILTSGLPTTVAGYGITNAVTNLSGAPAIQSGTDTAKPASATSGTIYFATDTKIIYQYNSGAWVAMASALGAGGTITALTGDVSASGSGSVAATVNSVGGSTAANVHSAELLANAATNANTASSLVKRDTSGNFTAGTITANLTGAASSNVLKTGDTMTGSLILSNNKGIQFTDSATGIVQLQAPTTVSTPYILKLPAALGLTGQVLVALDAVGDLSWMTPSTTATAYSGVLPVANGGTNSSATLAGNRIMVSTASSIIEGPSMGGGQILIGASGGAPTPATPAGDVTMTTAGAFTVTKIQGIGVSTTPPSASGQTLRYNGSAWTPNFISMADLRSTITGSSALTSCSASQTLTWSAATDNLTCSSINIADSQIAYGSETVNQVFAAPTTGNGTPVFRSLAAADLPSLASGMTGVLPASNGGTGLSGCPTGQVLRWSGSTWICFLPPMVEDPNFNIYTGTSALATNPNLSSYNIAIGDAAQEYMSPPSGIGSNISMGYQALRGSATPSSDTGAYNIGFGYQVLLNDTSGGNNIAMGYSSLATNSTGGNNTAEGYSALFSNTTGSYNIAMGASSLFANTTGSNNISFGEFALYNNATGGYNIALGLNALYIDAAGNQNIAIGPQAEQYQEATGTTNNIAIGFSALQGNTSTWSANTGTNNVALGPSALQINTSGSGNVAIGASAGMSPTAANGNTTGTDNVFIGYQAGPGTTTAIANVVAVGAMALVSGNQAVAVGNGATASGAGSIALGGSAFATASNAIAIGNGATAATTNTIVLGGSSTMNVGIDTSTPAYPLDVTGDIHTSTCIRTSAGISSGTCASDERLKTDIKPFNLGLNALQGINPKTYRYNGLGEQPASAKPELGVIAQDVEKTAPELVSTKMVKLKPSDQKETEIKVVNYNGLLYIVINSVKDLYAQFTMQDRTIASVKAENEKLKQENAEIKARLDHIEKLLNAK